MVTKAFNGSSVRFILFGSLLLIMILDPVDCAYKWPDWVKPCRKIDGPPDDCILKRINEALPHVLNGFPKAHIPNLDPIAITSMAINTGNKQVGLALVLNDCQFYGTKTSEFYKVHHDFQKKHCEFYWRASKQMLLGQYKMDGKVLLLPIHGKGDGNVTLTDVLAEMNLDYELVPKKGLHYAKIINSVLTFLVGKAHFEFTNLFNGDKYLGAQMNSFLNENEADLIREFGPAVGDALNQVFRSIIQDILDLIALETIYPDIEIPTSK